MDAPIVDTVTQATFSLGEFLFKYGPWGVSSILFILLVALYLHMSRKNAKDRQELTDKNTKDRQELTEAFTKERKELSEMLEKRNNQLMLTVQRCINAMTAGTGAIKDAKLQLHENTEILNKVKRTINRCEFAPRPKGGEDD